MWTGILLIILGVLALPHLFFANQAERKALLTKLDPITSVIGIFFTIWGIWSIIASFLAIGIIASNPISWILMLIVSLVTFGLGFILAFPLLKKYVFVSKKEKNEGDDVYHKLKGIQTLMGILAIIFGILSIVFGFLWT